jgi:UDP-GlcNAc:undecaprenyl-phosphate/decaprenyl-phosphate GlcNAc-1-phosphate transferase
MISTEVGAFLIIFCLSFSITMILSFIMERVGRKFRIVAKAGGRRQTEGDMRGVSKLGGVAIFFGFTVTIIVAQFLYVPRFDDWEVIRLAGLIIGGVVIFVVGLLDDIYEFNAIKLGIGQIIAAGIAIMFHIFIETFNNPLTGQQSDPWPTIVTITLSMLWLGLMMNTVNFMDGLDGLAGGVAFIAGTMLFINSAFILDPAQTSVSLLPLALMGASLAFLLQNFYPARIFMGGGAIFLGYLLGTLSIIGGAKMATILLVMGLPLMDLVWQAANRLRQGRNPMKGDRGHVHFRLLDRGFSQRQIVLVYYLFCTFFGVLTLITASRSFKFIAFGTMIALIVFGFALLARLNQGDSSTSS